MKRTLIGLFLFFLPLFASEQIENAVNSYKKGDYQATYEILSRLYLSNLADADFNFYLGSAAYETGHYELALAAFERVDILKPGNLRNKLEMARTYFMLKMYEDAEITFKDVLANPNIPQNVRSNIELYLSQVTKVQQKSFTYATVNLDWIYDSNVNYGTLGSIDYGGTTLTRIDPITDRAIQAYADLVNVYDIGEKNGFAVKNRFTALLKDYQREDSYDLQYFSYSPSLIYAQTRHFLELVLGIDDLYLGRKEYLHSAYIMPRYEYGHSDTLRSIAYLKYQRKFFKQQTDKALNAQHYEISYGLQKILSPQSYTQATVSATKEKKIDNSSTRVDVDYDEYKANLAYANQFTSVYGAELFTEYKRRNYKEYSTGFKSRRVDNGGTISATINAKVLQTVRLHLSTTYNRVESNQDRYSYDKYTISLGLNKTF